MVTHLPPTLPPDSCKIFNDAIHGHMEVPLYCMAFIDTPQFQRLRDLKQLGTTYYVYDTAAHNRFEHCLGVSHLAKAMVSQLKTRQLELEIEPRDLKMVNLAGLCHDLGHGPFSHAFEKWVYLRRPDLFMGHTPWSHEQMSLRVMDYLIDDNAIDIPREDVRFIQSLILGEQAGHTDKVFLYDIVANKRNGVDVDKLDYLARDSYNCGIKYSYDYDRLLFFSRVIDNEICFHAKESYNIYELFRTRYNMHKQVYSHPRAGAIQHMVSDVFTLADPHLQLSHQIEDIETYCEMTDSLLQRIEFSKEPELATSRALIRRIRTRQIYKLVDDVILSPEVYDQLISKKISARDIVCCAESGSGLDARDLGEEDLIFDPVTLNYGMQDRNPVDAVHFYAKSDINTKFHIDKDEVSSMLTHQFVEKIMRVFVRDASKLNLARGAFKRFLWEYCGIKDSASHPSIHC